jgi:REP element-mobilizing transposase RayT
MSLPLVIGYHLVWTGYGCWLPNDPRGSMSHCIKCDLISELGELHFGRKRVQPVSREIRAFYQRATPQLQFAHVEFTTEDVDQIASAFSREVEAQRYTCYACAIMPDHVHILIRKHKHAAEGMIQNLQRKSHLALRDSGRFDWEHPVWGGPGWKVFLDCPDDIERTIRYIEKNPVKIGQPLQRWDFVREYDGWPLHPGHSPNSPYAIALRKK